MCSNFIVDKRTDVSGIVIDVVSPCCQEPIMKQLEGLRIEPATP